VKNALLAAAVAGTLLLATLDASAQPASKDELRAMQLQMEALAERLNRLEAANASLRAENAELKTVLETSETEAAGLAAQTEALQVQSDKTSADLDKLSGADWASRIRFKGDLRYRLEGIWKEDTAERKRHRIRARFGFEAKITENSKAVVQLATGSDDPRSTNQTLGTSDSGRKAVGLDLAYFQWNWFEGSDVLLGKFKYPFWRPGQSLFFDGDYNPEGGAVTWGNDRLFASGYGWWLDEKYDSDRRGDNSDPWVFGGQLGLSLPVLDDSNFTAAIHYYDCTGCKDQSPIYANKPNGNSFYRVEGEARNLLLYDYNVLQFAAAMSFPVGQLPLTIWGDYANNLASNVEYDTAYGAGAQLGKASGPRSWEAGVFYQSIDKDALFGQFVDSDFGDGNTDSSGWVLKGGYAPAKNVLLNATYFVNTIDKDVGSSRDYDRLQLDVNWKF
jgi:hypothetical protein